MRIALALTLVATLVSAAMAAPPARRVAGTAERAIHAQGPCTGGVAVTNEQMQQWAAKTRRSLLARTAFTVFAGDRHLGKPVARFKTDRAGRFEVLLPEGVFCVMAGELSEKVEVAPETPNAPGSAASAYEDAQCLRDLALACDARLYVRGDDLRNVKLTLDTFTPCPQQWAQPCYRGPMPP